MKDYSMQHRMARAVRAMRHTEAFGERGLTYQVDVLETIIDQIALAMQDMGCKVDYDQFTQACWKDTL